MASGPNVKTSFQKLFDDTLTRVTLLERRVAIGGSGGDGGEPATIHPTGDIWQITDGVAPPNTLLTDGRAVSRTTYAELFAKIGTTYGNGDGSTTFNLPMLNGKQTIVNGAQGVVDGIFPPIGNSGQYPDAWDIFFALDNSAAGAANSELRMQLRAGGANVTAASYTFSRDGMGASNLQQTLSGQTYVEPLWGTMNTNYGRIRVNRGGQPARWTDFESVAGMRSGAVPMGVMQMAGSFAASAAHNGIALYANAGTLTGWIEAIPVGGSLVPSVIATKEITSGVVGTGTTDSGSGGQPLPAGVVVAWDGATVPNGFLLCDGSLVLRAAYPALFAVIGTTHGAGDGSTTFALPNYKGRVLVGRDVAQTEFDVLGELGGAKTHTLTNAELPPLKDNADFPVEAWNSNVAAGANGIFRRGVASSIGGGQAHNNLQPYAVANYIISTGSGSNPVTPVVPVLLWNEFTMAKPGGLRPLNSGLMVWDGTTTGPLGATLDATKRLITVPSAGTYRVITHYGLAANPGVGTSTAGYVDNILQPGTQDYGNAGAAGVYVSTQEWLFTATAPAIVSISAAAPLGMYDWTWMRIEKLEPFYAKDALTIQQGPTALRDSIYGVPVSDAEKASLANRMISWFNTDKGYFEIYYATTGTTGLMAKGLATGFPAGWYPAAGSNIWGAFPMLSAQTVAAGEVRINLNTGDLVGGMASGNNVMTVPVGGIYETNAHLYIWGTSGTYRGVQAFNVSDGTVYCSGTTSANWDIAATPRRARIPALAQIGLRTSGDAANTIQGQAWPALEVKYMGPPLVNG
jgi:microcystin-dependent protein